MTSTLLEGLRSGLIVSCQAEPGTPLGVPEILAGMAAAAVRGGAVGIRANGPANIAAVSRAVTVPLIGINKVVTPGSDVYITPTYADALDIHGAGMPPPAIIAFDATDRPRRDGGDWRTLARRLQTELGVLAMADIATHREGMAAAEAGVDLVATTLSGYTVETSALKAAGPDFGLVTSLANAGIRVICEGRVHTPELARRALDAGAFAVVVGTAITAIDWVTKTYRDAMHPL